MSKLLSFILLAFVWGILVGACTGRFLPQSEETEAVQDGRFAVVRVGPQDTLESLAQRYLGDEDKAWQIADYNHILKAQAGQRLVIPLKPVVYGGLRVDGYQTVPVLLYSRISLEDKPTKGISVKQFEDQLRFLKAQGYRSVPLDALYGFFNLEEQLPPKAILITFDSAQRWVYDIAYPILRKHGFGAAVFIPTGLIDQSGALRWDDLAIMGGDGFDIGACGVSARNLLSLSSEDPEGYLQTLEEEIAGSCKAITANLKRPCHYFAYPAGRTNDLIISLLKGHGYKASFSRQGGSNPFFIDHFKIARVVISNPMDEVQFRKQLTTFVPAELR